jgi:hypothetical protein
LKSGVGRVRLLGLQDFLRWESDWITLDLENLERDHVGEAERQIFDPVFLHGQNFEGSQFNQFGRKDLEHIPTQIQDFERC